MIRAKLKYVFWLTPVLVLLVMVWPGRSLIGNYFVNDCYEQKEEKAVALFYHDPIQRWERTELKHYTLVWKNTGIWTDDKLLKKDMQHQDVLITLETWLKSIKYGNVLSATLAGDFDKHIANLAHQVASSKHKVFIRWNADMEIPVKLYPWQYQSAVLYRRAFNYVAGRLKSLAPNIIIVWGPAGYPGDTEYWPGNKYVDLVSITLGSNSEYTANNYPRAANLREMLRLKMHRMRFIDKPVLILGTSKLFSKNIASEELDREVAYIEKYKDLIYSHSNYADIDRAKPVRRMLQMGVYDPEARSVKLPQLTVEHLFTDIGELQKGIFKDRFEQVIHRGHDVIVTLEPWRDTSSKADTNVIQSILTGRYDPAIRQLFSLIAKTKQTVYLRWMHEMEIPIHRYPWQSRSPVEYIQAFRYLMLFEGGPPENVKKVWGPAGDRGSIDFWPGDDVVDYISIAIYGLPDKNITDPKAQESFSDIFERKYYRMRFSGKPIFITEFGVKGPVAYQDAWLKDAANTIRSQHHVFGVSYFNRTDDPDVWGKIAAPKWSISNESFGAFLKEVGAP